MHQQLPDIPLLSSERLNSLNDIAAQLERQLEAAGDDRRLLNSDDVNDLLQVLAGSLRSIAEALRANGRQIAQQAGAARSESNVTPAQARLRALIDLHDAHLVPVIDVIDVHRDFRATTDRLSDLLRDYCDQHDAPFVERAKRLRQEIVEVQRSAILAAEEAQRELGPLCETAVRESRIAVGVNRALDAVRQGRWELLALDEHLPIVDDGNGPLFSDAAVGRCLVGSETEHSSLPHVAAVEPELLDIPVTAESLIDKLQHVESVDDLLAWIFDVCDPTNVDDAVRMLHSVIAQCPEHTHPTEERHEYEHHDMTIQATRWYWGDRDAIEPAIPFDDGDAKTARGRVPVAQARPARVP